MNLVQCAAMLLRAGAEATRLEPEALEKACVVVQTEAKRVVGTYEYGWPQLAESTQEQRVKEGFPANEPLLRTGEMRDSIEHTVEGRSGFVGSNDDKAVWQELGTSRGIPPRSFLGGAAIHKEEEIRDAIGDVIIKAFKE